MADLSSALVPSVAPAGLPDDYQHIRADASSFGGEIAKGTEKLGAGLDKASDNLFSINQFYGKIAVDDQINQVMTGSDRIRRGDPSRNVPGPDGKPQPDVGYLGLNGRAALEARAPTEKALDDLIESSRGNLKSPQEQLEFDTQTRRMRSLWINEISAHADSQFKTWTAGVNDASAAHALNGFAANLDNPEGMASHAKDYIDFKVRNAQLKFGDDPAIVGQTILGAKQELLKAQIAAKEVTDPVAALRILDKNRGIAGADYPALAERLRGRVDQQDGVSDADKRIAATSARPYASLSHPAYAAAATASPGGMSAAGIARTVQLESSGDPNAGTGGAHVGLGQFSVDTALQAGVGNRNDAEQSVRGIATLAAQNAPILQRTLGRAPTDAELYLAHQQGAGGASKLLANPNARAGDLVGDAAIKQNGGNPDAPASAFTALWKDKFDKASASSGEMGNAAALAHREGAIKSAILDDPALTARPQAQNAAIARVGAVFAAQRLQMGQDDAAFKLKLQNHLAEAQATGAVQDPLPKTAFVATWGSADGEKAYAEYQAAIQFGGDLHGTAAMSPEELQGLRGKYEARPGSEDYAAQLQRSAQLEKAIQANQKALAADPAAFVVGMTPAGQDAWKQFQQLSAEQGATPGVKTAYAQMFASKVLAEQARLGVAPEARTLLPEWYAKPIRDKIAATATAEDPKDRGATIPLIAAQKELWGSQWPQVASQISPPSAAPLVKAIAAGADPAAMQRLLEVPKGESPAKILKEQNEVTARNLNTSVNLAFAPLLSSMVGIQKERDYSGYLALGNELAALYVRDGKSEKDAAQNAFDDLIGKRYTFADTYRIPKAPDIDAASVQRGVYEATQEIYRVRNGDAASPFGNLQLQQNDLGVSDNEADMRRHIGRDGRFVTSPKAEGLNVMVGTKFLRNANGNPVLLTWDQLQKLGGSKEARAADAARGVAGSAQQP